MSRSDLAAVEARRAAIAEKLQELEAVGARLESEIHDLDTTARVLKRLGAAGVSRQHLTAPVQYVVAEPLHRQAIARLKSLLMGDPR
jgi:hypothetical protein